MSRVFIDRSVQNEHRIKKLVPLLGRLYYLVNTYNIRLPQSLTRYLPQFGINWDKAHISRSAAEIVGMEALADELWRYGERGGQSSVPVKEVRDLLTRIFLSFIIPTQNVSPSVIDELAYFGSVQSLMQDSLVSAKDLLNLDASRIEERVWPTETLFLQKLLGPELWPGIHIFGAHPGMGKTSLMMAFATAYADKGLPVFFVETELSEIVMKRRFERALASTGESVQENLYFLFGGVSASSLKTYIDDLSLAKPPLLIVDIPDVLIGFYDDPRRALNYVYTQLNILLLEGTVSSVFATSHLTRESQQGKSHLAETSFKLRIASSVIMFSSEPYSEERYLIEAEVVKNRFGPVNVFGRFVFDMQTLTFDTGSDDIF